MNRIVVWLAELASYGFAVIIAMMVYEVVARYGFGAPTYWAHEIAGLLGAVAFLLGGAYCMVEGTLMRITALTEKAPPRLARAFEIIGGLCGVIYLGGLAFSGWKITQQSLFRFMADGSWSPERSGTSWNTPSPGFVKAALFVGTVLFLAVVLKQLFAALTRPVIERGAEGAAD